MLFNGNGKYAPLGETHNTMVFNPGLDLALPSWLTALGSSPVLTFNAVASGQAGNLTMQTKVASPTDGDIAGVQTQVIDTGQYSEIGLFIQGMKVDAGMTVNNANFEIITGDNSTTGLRYGNQVTDGGMVLNIPPAADVAPVLQYFSGGNLTKRKNFGVIIRPKTGEVFITTGDPADGAGVVRYARGHVNSINNFQIRIRTRTAAQRSFNFAQLKLRLSMY